jgi:hypothetical protein
MGDTAVDPDILKHTQDTLGQIINAPALTEKLLSRPPVQFLQDIVKSVWQSHFCLFLQRHIYLGYKKNEFSSRIIF